MNGAISSLTSWISTVRVLRSLLRTSPGPSSGTITAYKHPGRYILSLSYHVLGVPSWGPRSILFILTDWTVLQQKTDRSARCVWGGRGRSL